MGFEIAQAQRLTCAVFALRSHFAVIKRPTTSACPCSAATDNGVKPPCRPKGTPPLVRLPLPLLSDIAPHFDFDTKTQLCIPKPTPAAHGDPTAADNTQHPRT
eukprot:3066220-Rhodomonas_salina.1